MKSTAEELAAWRLTFRLVFDAHPAQVALLDLQGLILATNRGWKSFGNANGLAESYDCVGTNYLDACEAGAVANAPGSKDAYVGLLEVLNTRRPVFTMVYPCHTPIERRWYRLWVQPQAPHIPAVIVAHYECSDRPKSFGNFIPESPATPPRDAERSDSASFTINAPAAEPLGSLVFLCT